MMNEIFFKKNLHNRRITREKNYKMYEKLGKRMPNGLKITQWLKSFKIELVK